MELSDLNGARGIVYLMFLGRETYAGAFQKKLVKEGLLKDESNVNQCVSFLLKNEFLRDVKELKEPGKPKIRTADKAVLYETLRVWAPKLSQEEVKEIMFWVDNLGDAIDFFPNYLALRLRQKNNLLIVRTLPWNYTLGDFFFFCQFILWAFIEEIEDESFEITRKLLNFETDIKHAVNSLMPLPEELKDLQKVAQQAVNSFSEEQKHKISNHFISMRDNKKLAFGILFPSVAFQLVLGRWHGLLFSMVEGPTTKITSRVFKRFLKENL